MGHLLLITGALILAICIPSIYQKTITALWSLTIAQADRYHPEKFEIAVRLAQCLGPNDPLLAVSYYQWAFNARDRQQAIALYSKCLDSEQTVSKGDSQLYRQTLDMLASNYCFEGDVLRAAEFLEKATLLQLKHVPPERSSKHSFYARDLLSRWNELAQLKIQLAKYDQAREILKTAHSFYLTEKNKFLDDGFCAGEEKNSVLRDEEILIDYGNYSQSIQRLQGMLKYPVPHDFERSQKIFQTYSHTILTDFKNRGRAAIVTLRNLADLERKEGNHQLAITLYKLCVDIQAGEVESSAPYTMQNMIDLNVILNRWRNAESWSRLFIDVTKSNDINPGPYADALDSHARVLAAQGKNLEAEKEFLTAIEVRAKRSLKRPERLQACCELASLYISEGKYSDALALLGPAIQVYKSYIGAQHPITACAMEQYSVACAHLGRTAEADQYHQRYLAVKNLPQYTALAKFPPQHHFTEVLDSRGFGPVWFDRSIKW